MSPTSSVMANLLLIPSFCLFSLCALNILFLSLEFLCYIYPPRSLSVSASLFSISLSFLGPSPTHLMTVLHPAVTSDDRGDPAVCLDTRAWGRTLLELSTWLHVFLFFFFCLSFPFFFSPSESSSLFLFLLSLSVSQPVGRLEISQVFSRRHPSSHTSFCDASGTFACAKDFMQRRSANNFSLEIKYVINIACGKEPVLHAC